MDVGGTSTHTTTGPTSKVLVHTVLVFPCVGVTRYYKPLQLALVVKEKNGGKLNSHLWFFSAFVKQLQPDYCVVSPRLGDHLHCRAGVCYVCTRGRASLPSPAPPHSCPHVLRCLHAATGRGHYPAARCPVQAVRHSAAEPPGVTYPSHQYATHTGFCYTNVSSSYVPAVHPGRGRVRRDRSAQPPTVQHDRGLPAL
jgi:hypothetical protein